MEDAVRSFAAEYHMWAVEQNMSYGQLAYWTGAIEMLAKATGSKELLEELKENGIV